MTNLRTTWRRRTGGVALGAALTLATILGPGAVLATRLGAGEVVGFSTVSAADTITSRDVLADGASAGRLQ
jgi:hypothetical protein